MNDSTTRRLEQLPDEEATEHTRSRYDTAAPVYDLMEWPVEYWLYRAWREMLWADVEGPEVLEIGVGTGKNIPYYPNDTHVTGIDLSPEMLRRARRVARSHPEKNVILREMDAQALDLPDDTFDDMVATFVFCSVPDPVQGLREAFQVTKPGGRLHLLEHMRAHASQGASARPRHGRARRPVPLAHGGPHCARDRRERSSRRMDPRCGHAAQLGRRVSSHRGSQAGSDDERSTTLESALSTKLYSTHV